MKAVIQRVNKASVTVNNEVVGSIEKGFLVLLGVCEDDTIEDTEILARKVAALRVFCDENDKMNLSLIDVKGEALVISNFTLCADTKKGNRPSFIGAKAPEEANAQYLYFCDLLCKNGVEKVEKGVFGGDMQVSLVNDGPITIILDTEIWRKKV